VNWLAEVTAGRPRVFRALFTMWVETVEPLS